MTAQSAAPRLSKLQQQRSRETREKLIMAANRLWRLKGFDETTVSEVCDAAGVSKGTFYFYFLRKEDLLLELAVTTSERVWTDWERLLEGDRPTDEIAQEVVSSIANRVTRTPRALLERTVLELLASAGERWRGVRGGRKDLGQVFRSVVERGIGRGEISDRFDPTELGDMITILLLQGMLEWARGVDEALESIFIRRTELILRGAAP